MPSKTMVILITIKITNNIKTKTNQSESTDPEDDSSLLVSSYWSPQSYRPEKGVVVLVVGEEAKVIG